jgi:GNAT superfamily N-acetyltransferase
MEVTITEEGTAVLGEYAGVSSAFVVDCLLDLAGHGLGGLPLSQRRLEVPTVKDYDADSGEGPAGWAREFDMSRWGVLAARAAGRCVGGAVIAFDTPGVDMLEGRRDLAVLWDLRVAPEARGKGIGSRLFQAAEAWATARGCRQLKIETQNINVPACRFYARQGCVLGAIHRFAYPDLPDEIGLLWYKDLSPSRTTRERPINRGLADVRFCASPEVSNTALNDLFRAAWPSHDDHDFQVILSRSLAYLCAFAGERLVGFVNLAWDGGAHAFLLDPTVHPDHRHCGIGSELVRRAAACAREAHVEHLHVDYEPRLTEFYRRCGFRPTAAGLLTLADLPDQT